MGFWGFVAGGALQLHARLGSGSMRTIAVICRGAVRRWQFMAETYASVVSGLLPTRSGWMRSRRRWRLRFFPMYNGWPQPSAK
ncbi:hypothetical protein A8144_11940 [Mycobacterium leprae 3125609]|nr:hypothetical protein A8144_11940 [Mycobacterium leprae 3125609]OAX70514.1 hypothetical protein A3216_11575 [Mycobacterium leprae 7935681]